MKKFLFSLLTLAAALTVASCQKELVGNPDPILGGPAINATLSVNVNGVATKAFAAAENAKKLHIAFYSGGEMVASISKVGVEAIDLTSTTYNYNIKLSRGAAYDIICWAEAAESPYALDFNAKTVTYKDNVSLTANNDAYDAFYGVASLTADQTKNAVDLTIELKRPFAQVNVLVPDENAAAYTSFSSAMTVTVPTTMSLADGSLSGNPIAVTFANAAINEATIKDGHKYVAMNYVFAPAEAANYAVSFTVTPNVAEDAKTRTLDAVSLKRNRRTNLVGNIFDDTVDNITVVIIPTPGDPTEQDINAVDADLDISLDPEATLDVPVDQTASFNITTNSTGAASVASANENFATAELTTDGSAQATNTHTVTVTGVANGTTTVTVDIAAGQTKASLKPAQVVVTVKVGTGEPDPATKTLESIAISDYTTEYTVGDTFTFDGTVTATYSDGTSASVEGATVSDAPNMTAAAENVPFTVSYTEGDITMTANGSITVAAAPSALDNPVTFDFGEIHADATSHLELSTEEQAPVVVTFDKNEAAGGATVPAYNKNDQDVRLYTHNTMTVSSEKYISKIEFVFTSGYEANSAAFAQEAYDSGTYTWTGSTKSLVIMNPSATQIRIKKMIVTWSDDPVTWPAVDPALSFAESSVSVEVGAKHTQVATSDAGYTGAITYSSSNPSVATVDASTGQVTGVVAGNATITATSTATSRFTAGSTTYDVTVIAATSGPKTETVSGTFTMSDGTLSLTTESGITITQEKGTGTTNVNATYNTATTLRIYKGHILTISAPSGKKITAINFTNTDGNKGCEGISSNVGTFTRQENCTWTGNAASVVITNTAKGNETTQFRPTKIEVTYE